MEVTDEGKENGGLLERPVQEEGETRLRRWWLRLWDALRRATTWRQRQGVDGAGEENAQQAVGSGHLAEGAGDDLFSSSSNSRSAADGAERELLGDRSSLAGISDISTDSDSGGTAWYRRPWKRVPGKKLGEETDECEECLSFKGKLLRYARTTEPDGLESLVARAKPFFTIPRSAWGEWGSGGGGALGARPGFEQPLSWREPDGTEIAVWFPRRAGASGGLPLEAEAGPEAGVQPGVWQRQEEGKEDGGKEEEGSIGGRTEEGVKEEEEEGRQTVPPIQDDERQGR